MWDNYRNIENLKVSDLTLPGTHDSGSYIEPGALFNSVTNSVIWAQEETILNQLKYGVRFLDIR